MKTIESQIELNFSLSGELKNRGMEQAINHACEMEDNWKERAYELLKTFVLKTDVPFMAEQVRSYAALIGFPLPPSNRAWGGIISRAANSGLIQRVGIGKVSNTKAHQANASIWIRNGKN
jgi:hypothetical protein